MLIYGAFIKIFVNILQLFNSLSIIYYIFERKNNYSFQVISTYQKFKQENSKTYIYITAVGDIDYHIASPHVLLY